MSDSSESDSSESESESDLWSVCDGREGDVKGVRAALGRGGEPNSRGPGDSNSYQGEQTCLMAAAIHGHVGVVEELLRHPGIRVNDTSSNNITALHSACTNGHAAVVQLLVAHPGIDCNARWRGLTPLMWAVCPPGSPGLNVGRDECVRVMLGVEG